MNKQQLREIYRQKREELLTSEVEKLSLKISEQFMLLPKITENCVYHIFMPITKHNEINTLHIVKKLWKIKKTIVVPRMNPGKTEMDTCLLLPNTKMISNSYDIHEPECCQRIYTGNIDVMILPLLSYDKKGYRIGYGKGYYDRFIAGLKKPVFKVGLSFFDPDTDHLTSDTWDVPMDCCVTPEKFIQF